MKEALRQGVEALLLAHDESGGPVPNGLGRDAAATANWPRQARPGTLVAGRYKLIEPIGEGGMGTVWMAEQKEPVRRKAAVKLIKPGMDSQAVLARF